jgi:hypothetical protein
LETGDGNFWIWVRDSCIDIVSICADEDRKWKGLSGAIVDENDPEKSRENGSLRAGSRDVDCDFRGVGGEGCFPI